MREIGGNQLWVYRLRRLLLGGIFTAVLFIQFAVFDPRRPDPDIAVVYTAEQDCLMLQGVMAESAALTVEWDVMKGMKLSLGDTVMPDVVLLLEPEGYVGLKGGEVVRPLQTFPHVQLAGNEIWVDVVNERVIEIRVNREIYWQGEVRLNGREWQVSCVAE